MEKNFYLYGSILGMEPEGLIVHLMKKIGKIY